MKKLALALVCLFSIAFFASCDPTVEHPEPAISIATGEGYLYDGCIADIGVWHPFGFQLASNAQTNEPLATVRIEVGNDEIGYQIYEEKEISGDTYLYESEIGWGMEDREIIAQVAIVCTVIDAAGKSNTATINVNLNENDALEVTQIQWERKGSSLLNNTEADMAANGLWWDRSYKDYFASIKPLNSTLYVIENALDQFNAIETTVQKANFFTQLTTEGAVKPVDVYRNINVTNNTGATYNDILAVVESNGATHLILVGSTKIETGAYGTWITIYGQTK